MLKEGQLASLVDIAKSLNPLAKARPAKFPQATPPRYTLHADDRRAGALLEDAARRSLRW